MSDYLLVITTTPSREQGEALLHSAVGAQLAGNGQVSGPASAASWHLGEFTTGEEWQLLLRTTADRYQALESHLLANHPWSNPEVIALPITAGSGTYLHWLGETTGRPE